MINRSNVYTNDIVYFLSVKKHFDVPQKLTKGGRHFFGGNKTLKVVKINDFTCFGKFFFLW